MDNSISDLFSTNEIFDSFDLDADFNHLRVIFEEILCTVSFIDVERTVFYEEIPKLQESCNNVIRKITELLQSDQTNKIEEIKTLIQRYNTLVKFATDAVKYVNKRVEFQQVLSLPLPICNILLCTFKHCKESDQLYGNHFPSVSSLLTDLFKRANELQSSYLHLMNNLITFQLLEQQQNAVVVQVIETLSNIGEIITSLDIKSTAELWKGYLILTQTNIEFIKSTINIEKPLRYFCREVEKAFKLFETPTDSKKVETNLKITSFNLKIIIKLCGLYDYLGDAYADLFHLLLTLNRYFIPYLHFQGFDPKIIDLMQVYVCVAAEPLLNCFMSSREFAQHFIKNINSELNNDNTRLAGTLLIISVIKKIINGTEETHQIWVSNDNFYDIICIIFTMLDIMHVQFSIDLQISIATNTGERNKICSLYEYLLIHTVSLILISNEKYYKSIQKLLFESIMQTNIWKALFAADTWCILARYGPEHSCFHQLIFLIKVFLMFENHVMKPEIFFLKNIINRLFQLLTNKYKTEILQAYPVSKYHRLWINIDNNNLNNQLIYNQLNKFMSCVDVVHFNDMMKSLELIHTIKKSNEIQQLTEVVKKLWGINERNLQFFWQFQFIWNLCKATTFLIQYFNNKDLLMILQRVQILSESNKRMQLMNCMILKSLATKSIGPIPDQAAVFTAISQIFKIALKDKQPVIKQRALETFTFFAQHTNHETILSYVVDGDTDLQEEISNYLQKNKCSSTMNSIDYYKKQSCVKFRHECESLEPALKKMKNNDQVNVDVVLSRIKYDTDILKEYFENKYIPPSCVNDLTDVVDKLQNLLKK